MRCDETRIELHERCKRGSSVNKEVKSTGSLSEYCTCILLWIRMEKCSMLTDLFLNLKNAALKYNSVR